MQFVNEKNQFVPLKIEAKVCETKFKNWRAELISRLVKGINDARAGTKFKPITERVAAIRANSNPFLKNDGELELLIKDCEKRGNYSRFFWVTK